LEFAQSQFLDTSVSYGQKYGYRARAVRIKNNTRVPGPWSDQIEVAVEDVNPPRPPSFIEVALTPLGLRLNWESLKDDPTVLGYFLYRRLGSDGTFKRLGGLLTDTVFIDHHVAPGQRVSYRVTAVDNSPGHNESLPSPEAHLYSGDVEPSEEIERPPFEDPGL
jgi:hypothetical protein